MFIVQLVVDGSTIALARRLAQLPLARASTATPSRTPTRRLLITTRKVLWACRYACFPSLILVLHFLFLPGVLSRLPCCVQWRPMSESICAEIYSTGKAKCVRDEPQARLSISYLLPRFACVCVSQLTRLAPRAAAAALLCADGARAVAILGESQSRRPVCGAPA
jgi:hypothetical protein